MEAKRFPFLSDQEREQVSQYEKGVLGEKSIIDLMLNFSEKFREAKSGDERIANRSKLLDLAGLYEIIPVQKFESAKNKPLSLTLLEMRIENDEDPFQALMRCGEIPFDMLANFPNFKEFFNVKAPTGNSYNQDLVAKQSEIGGIFVVIKSNINEEVKEYVSASSEPLTRSILLNPYVDFVSKEIRDFASMAYDLVMQIEFLSIFYQQAGTLNRAAIQGAMRLRGLGFALDVFAYLAKRAIEEGHIELVVLPEEARLINKGGTDGAELCQYLHYLLYSLAAATIENLNQILGLETADKEIGKVLIEHAVGFDPRRTKLKLIDTN